MFSLIVLPLLLASCATAIDLRALKFVHLVYRHGDRAPSGKYGDKCYPNDTYGIEQWPAGWQELTPLGMQQHYALGKYFRSRYGGANYLSADYKKTEIYIQSTDKDRTLESAQANLAGLYEPSGQQIWNPDIKWQPIPVHTMPLDSDMLIANYIGDIGCKPYDEAIKNITYIQEMNKQYDGLFKFLETQTGVKNITFENVDDIQGCIGPEMAHGLKQPLWVYQIWPQYGGSSTQDLLVKLKDLAKMEEYDSPLKGKLSGGLLLGDIITRTRSATAGTLKPKTLKVQMYSAVSQCECCSSVACLYCSCPQY